MARPKKTPVEVAEATVENLEPVVETAQPFELTPEELAAVLAARKQVAASSVDATQANQLGIEELAKALALAIESTRPPQKKTPFNRVKPWEEKKAPFKRTWYQHGMEITPRQVSAAAIDLMNKVKPGNYVNGLIRVIKNKDRSYNITWPVATAAQRMRVIQDAGPTIEAILQRCIDEKNDPRQFKGPEDDDD